MGVVRDKVGKVDWLRVCRVVIVRVSNFNVNRDFEIGVMG